MKCKLLLFAFVREKAGWNEKEVEISESTDVATIKQILIEEIPEAAELLGSCRFAVNDEYAEDNTDIPDGAEVSVIPPVSGGSTPGGYVQVYAAIVEHEINIETLQAKIAGSDAGAMLTFSGAVRTSTADDSRDDVTEIQYEGHKEMATSVLLNIAQNIADKYSVRVAVVHRLGLLSAGEVSVGIAVASTHRASGFDALREVIEEIKKDLPVWKKEIFNDGTEKWAKGS